VLHPQYAATVTGVTTNDVSTALVLPVDGGVVRFEGRVIFEGDGGATGGAGAEVADFVRCLDPRQLADAADRASTSMADDPTAIMRNLIADMIDHQFGAS